MSEAVSMRGTRIECVWREICIGSRSSLLVSVAMLYLFPRNSDTFFLATDSTRVTMTTEMTWLSARVVYEYYLPGKFAGLVLRIHCPRNTGSLLTS